FDNTLSNVFEKSQHLENNECRFEDTDPKFCENLKFDGFLKSPQIVMPDLIRHPERVDITGFRLSPE
ncbi:MAG: hypothetical protein PVF32_10655, partial [Desulfobacterales bacterium]